MYECALLKNLLDQTPVIPVFVAEKHKNQGDGKPQYTPMKLGPFEFPEAVHVRSESGLKAISILKYAFLWFCMDFLPLLLCVLCYIYCIDNTAGSRFPPKRQSSWIASRQPWQLYPVHFVHLFYSILFHFLYILV